MAAAHSPIELPDQAEQERSSAAFSANEAPSESVTPRRVDVRIPVTAWEMPEIRDDHQAAEIQLSELAQRAKRAVWRAVTIAEAQDSLQRLRWLLSRADASEEVRALYYAARSQLLSAGGAAARRGRLVQLLTGADVQSSREYLAAAQLNILRLADSDYLRAVLPNLVADARRNLPPQDLRRQNLERIAASADVRDYDALEQNQIILASQATRKAQQHEELRLRGFRNVLAGVSAMIALLSVAVAIVGVISPSSISLCYLPLPGSPPACPSGQAAPSSADIPLVLFVGLLAGAIAAATGLRGIRGSSDPYSIPVALAVLKVVSGGFTAFLGLLMIRGSFVPGFNAIDTSEQIIGWAVVLGYSQQVFTRLVDKQAQTVLTETGQFGSQSQQTDTSKQET